MSKFICQLMILCTLFSCTGCIRLLHIDGPYVGKVIDAETGQPIEGAVVHAAWFKRRLAASTLHYDDYECLTDQNGDFNIPGQGVVPYYVDWPLLAIFKAGYQHLKPTYWLTLKGGFPRVVTWRGNEPTFRFKRLSMEERLRRSVGEAGGAYGKERLWRMETNKELIEIGKPDFLLPLE